MPERDIDYGRFHADAPVLFLPASFYPREWRDEDSVANPSAYLRLVYAPNASGASWRIEPGYDIENKTHYRSPFYGFYYLVASFAAGYFDVFAIDGQERAAEQPVFYQIYVYNPAEKTFRRVDTEEPIYELRRINEFVAIPGPSHFVRGVRLFLAERSAIERDPQHFLKELSTPR